MIILVAECKKNTSICVLTSSYGKNAISGPTNPGLPYLHGLRGVLGSGHVLLPPMVSPVTALSGLNFAHGVSENDFYAKFLLVITHRNTLQTKKKDNNVWRVFYYEYILMKKFV